MLPSLTSVKLVLKMSQIFKKKKGENPANCGWCQGYSEVSDCFLSTLDSAQREKGEKRRRRVKKRGGGTGQLQCGQVCRVSRERERFRMKHYGIDWTGLNTG